MNFRYNPEKSPNSKEWLAEDEDLRILAVERFHRKYGDYGESLTMHSAIHAIVETQLAEGLQPALDALTRLRKEGLTRHEAIHAIGSAVAGHIFHLTKGNISPGDGANEAYFQASSELTRQSWYDNYGDAQ
jgi:hypothetical protein